MPRPILYTLITLELIGSIGGLALAFYALLVGNQFWASIAFLAVCGLSIQLARHSTQVL